MNRKQSQEERRRSIENAVTKALKEARDQAAQELRKSVAAAKASREAAIISAREEAARGKISLSFACFIFFVWSVVVAIGTIRLWDRQQSAIHAKKSEERIKEEAKLAAEGRARIEELDEKLKVQTSRAESLVEQTKAAQEEVISALKAEHTAAVEALKAQHHKELRGANEGFQEALAASNIETKSASEASEAKVKERIQAAVAEAAAEAERKAVQTALREKEKAVQEARVKASLEAKDAAKLAENAKATAVREALAKAEADASASSDSKDQLEAAEVKHLEAIDALKKELQAKAESDSKTMAKDLTAARQKVQELEKQLEAANRKTQKVEAALHEVEDDLQQLKTNASSSGAATESSASSSLHASGATVAAASSLSSAEASDAWDPRQSGLTPSASWKATIARPGVFRTVVLQDMGAESSNPFVYTGTVNKEGEPHGKGEARFSNNDCYDGEFDNGTWHGAGTYKYASGDAEVSRYDNGNLVKEGVRWSPERTTAWKMKDGKILKKSGFGFGGKEVEITLAEAAKIAEDLGVNVPAIEVIDMNVKANGDLPFRCKHSTQLILPQSAFRSLPRGLTHQH